MAWGIIGDLFLICLYYIVFSGFWLITVGGIFFNKILPINPVAIYWNDYIKQINILRVLLNTIINETPLNH